MTFVLRRLALWLGLGVLPALGLGFGPALAGSDAACAAASSGAPHAALVVDTGSDVTTYCVALGASSISGIQLIQKAGLQLGLAYRLGFGGQAVCMLNGVGGPSSDDCLTGQSSYWGYWAGNGSGGWTWSSVGAASTTVHDGEVQGWAWGVGIDGMTHPQPPSTSIDDVCKVAPTPTPKPPGGGGAGGGGGNGNGGAGSSPTPSSHPVITPTAAASPSSRPSRHRRSPSPPVHVGGPRTAVPLGNLSRIATPGPLASASSGGSPIGVLLALGLTAALGVGGWLRVRSGRPKAPR